MLKVLPTNFYKPKTVFAIQILHTPNVKIVNKMSIL